MKTTTFELVNEIVNENEIIKTIFKHVFIQSYKTHPILSTIWLNHLDHLSILTEEDFSLLLQTLNSFQTIPDLNLGQILLLKYFG